MNIGGHGLLDLDAYRSFDVGEIEPVSVDGASLLQSLSASKGSTNPSRNLRKHRDCFEAALATSRDLARIDMTTELGILE